MSEHLSLTTLAQLCARTLPVAALVEATEHLAVCRACHAQWRQLLAERRGGLPLRFSLSSEAWLAQEHLSDAEVIAYLDQGGDTTAQEMAELHVAGCPACRAQVQSLRAFRRVTAAEMRVLYQPRVETGTPVSVSAELTTLKAGRAWWRGGLGWGRSPSYALAALLVLMSLTASVLWWAQRRTAPPPNSTQVRAPLPTPALVVQAAPPTPVASPMLAPDGAPRPAPATSQNRSDQPAPSVSPRQPALRPARPTNPLPRHLAQSANGLRGRQPAPAVPQAGRASSGVVASQSESETARALAQLPTALQAQVQQVWDSATLDKPAVLEELANPDGTLRTAAPRTTGPAWRLLSPLGRVTQDVQPVLVWTPLAQAVSYRVYVLDAAGQETALSPVLPATQTSWRVPTPLVRGVTYAWAIVAQTTDGAEVVAPAPPTPEARFHVLAAVHAQALRRVARRAAPLVRGILYAQAGLLPEAARELRRAAQVPAQAATARKLLTQIERWQRPTPSLKADPAQ